MSMATALLAAPFAAPSMQRELLFGSYPTGDVCTTMNYQDAIVRAAKAYPYSPCPAESFYWGARPTMQNRRGRPFTAPSIASVSHHFDARPRAIRSCSDALH